MRNDPILSQMRFYMRLHTFYMQLFTVFCVPLFYHALRNSLIINEFNILHREVVGLSNYSITKLLG